MSRPLLVGAVVYDPKVVAIWEIIADFMASVEVRMDTVFYTNYELQVQALVNGQIDIAWNSPLAWLDTVRLTNGACQAIAMRDTDRDRVSHLLVRAESEIRQSSDLRGTTIAFGASDSPQATLIPQGFLLRQGLQPGEDYEVRRFDVLVGKHGDHVGGEQDALASLLYGESDASWALDLNWQLWSSNGTCNPESVRVMATTEPFDHCVFTVRGDFEPERVTQFRDGLFRMSYDNPEHRQMMDMEGLKRWEPGRTSGFGQLTEAVSALNYWGRP